MEECGKIQREKMRETFRGIKQQGVANWAEEMQRKVNASYCYLDEKTRKNRVKIRSADF